MRKRDIAVNSYLALFILYKIKLDGKESLFLHA